MAIYEYVCSSCGEVYEKIYWKDRKTIKCKKCGKKAKKIMSKTHFVLKGGGWYADGYSKRSE